MPLTYLFIFFISWGLGNKTTMLETDPQCPPRITKDNIFYVCLFGQLQ